MAVENDFAFQLVPVLLDMVVLDHNHHHVHLFEEVVEVQNLVFDNLFVGKERVEGLQGAGQVSFLNVSL